MGELLLTWVTMSEISTSCTSFGTSGNVTAEDGRCGWRNLQYLACLQEVLELNAFLNAIESNRKKVSVQTLTFLLFLSIALRKVFSSKTSCSRWDLILYVNYLYFNQEGLLQNIITLFYLYQT